MTVDLEEMVLSRSKLHTCSLQPMNFKKSYFVLLKYKWKQMEMSKIPVHCDKPVFVYRCSAYEGFISCLYILAVILSY